MLINDHRREGPTYGHSRIPRPSAAQIAVASGRTIGVWELKVLCALGASRAKGQTVREIDITPQTSFTLLSPAQQFLRKFPISISRYFLFSNHSFSCILNMPETTRTKPGYLHSFLLRADWRFPSQNGAVLSGLRPCLRRINRHPSLTVSTVPDSNISEFAVNLTRKPAARSNSARHGPRTCRSRIGRRLSEK